MISPPGFVAESPKTDPPGLLAPVRAPQIGHRALAVVRQALDPLFHLAHGSAPDIPGDVRFGSNLFTEVHELMCAEMVVLGHTPQLVLTMLGRLSRGPMPSIHV